MNYITWNVTYYQTINKIRKTHPNTPKACHIKKLKNSTTNLKVTFLFILLRIFIIHSIHTHMNIERGCVNL